MTPLFDAVDVPAAGAEVIGGNRALWWPRTFELLQPGLEKKLEG